MVLTHKWLNDTSNLLLLFCEYCGRASSLVIPAPLYRDRQMHILGHQHPEPSVPAQSMEKRDGKTHLHVHLCLISLPIANSNSPVQLCVNCWSSVLQMRVKCRSTMGQRLFKFGSSVSQLSVNRASNVVQALVKARTTVGQFCSNCRSIMRQSLVKHGSKMRQRWVN